MFHDRSTAVSSPASATLDYLNQHDGASNTLLFSEKLGVPGWCYYDTSAKAWLTYAPNTGYESIGFVWKGESWDPHKQPVPNNVSGHISSNHGGGIHACFADGHTRFIRDNIDYNTYQAIMTPNGLRHRKNSSNVYVERGVTDSDY